MTLPASSLFDRTLRTLVDHEWRRPNPNAAARLTGWAGLYLGTALHHRSAEDADALPLRRLMQRLSGAPSAEEVYRRALQEVLDLSGAERALLAGQLGGDGMFHVLAERNVPPELLQSLRRFVLRPGDAFYDLTTRGKAFWLSEVLGGRTPELLPAPLLRGLIARLGDVLLMPLHFQGELTALLALAAPGARRPDPAVLATLNGLRPPLAQALHRAQLMYALERSEAQAQATLSGLQEGVLRVASTGELLASNEAAYRLLGVPWEVLKGHSALCDGWEVYDVHGVRLTPDRYPVARALQGGETVRGESLRLHLKGRSLWLSVNAAPLHEQGEVSGAVLSFADVTEAHELRLRLEHQALHDSLTGLPGRRALERQLQRMERGALLLLDLNRFSEVNSAHGLHAGDVVLCEVAKRLQAQGQGTVARLAADEFGVVLPGADLAAALAVADRLQAELRRPFALPGVEKLRLSASVGVCAGDDIESQKCYRNASLALAEAKAAGPGEVRVFRTELLDRQRRRAEVQRRLRQTLDAPNVQGLQMHYQPIVGGDTPRLEALARWVDPELGAVNPAEFIAVAEASGLMPRLGEVALDMALRAAVGWSERLGAAVNVSVNVSASQLALPDFTRRVCAALERSAAHPERLTLEVTEAVVMHDPERVARCLQSLRELGVRVALDDFGTGFSSLSLLHQLPIDVIKVDRSFVRCVHEHPRRHVLLRAVAAMGRELGTELVAEGVETERELDTLWALGYRRFQGHLFARPQPPEAVLAALGVAHARARELTLPELTKHERFVTRLTPL